MLVFIHNLCEDIFQVSSVSPFDFLSQLYQRRRPPACNVVHVGSKAVSVVRLAPFRNHFDLQRINKTSTALSFYDEKAPLLSQERADAIHIRIPFLNSKWRAVRLGEAFPWRIYLRKITSKRCEIIIMTKRSPQAFMSLLPDSTPLASICLPGTHNTMAIRGRYIFAQCQSPSTPLLTQLNDGIRFLDIRLAMVPSPGPDATVLDPSVEYELIAHHGIISQETSLQSILEDIQSFLSSPETSQETVIVSIKQEDGADTPWNLFGNFLLKHLRSGPGGWENSVGSGKLGNAGMWFLENRIPLLGEARGKAVLFSRFDVGERGWGPGIHPSHWPNNEKDGFEWTIDGTTVRTHDWYSLPSTNSIPEKFDLACANLKHLKEASPTVLPITFFSGLSLPLGRPYVIATGFGWPKVGLGIEGVNSRLSSFLLDYLTERPSSSSSSHHEKCEGQKIVSTISGWTLLDYYTEPDETNLLPLLIELNFLDETT